MTQILFCALLAVVTVFSMRAAVDSSSLTVLVNFNNCLGNISLDSKQGCISANNCLSDLFDDIEPFLQSKAELRIKLEISQGVDSLNHDCDLMYSGSKKNLVSCQLNHLSACLNTSASGGNVCSNMKALATCLGTASVDCFNRIYTNFVRTLAFGIWDSNNCAYLKFPFTVGEGRSPSNSSSTSVTLNHDLDADVIDLDAERADAEEYFGSSYAPANSRVSKTTLAPPDYVDEHQNGDHTDLDTTVEQEVLPVADRSNRNAKFPKNQTNDTFDPLDVPLAKNTSDNPKSVIATDNRQAGFVPSGFIPSVTEHEMLPTVDIADNPTPETTTTQRTTTPGGSSVGASPAMDGRSKLLFCGSVLLIVVVFLVGLY